MLKKIGDNIEQNKKVIIEEMINKFNEKNKDVEGEVYIGYPIFIDNINNRTITIDAIFITKKGVIVLNMLNSEILDYDFIQDEIYTKLESKLKKYQFLLERRNLTFDIKIVTYFDKNTITPITEYPIINSVDEFLEFSDTVLTECFSDEQYDNINSGIQEAYGIRNRLILENIEKPKAKAIVEMNNLIEKYDINQMEAILCDSKGIQRIRGMAGSGKTIVIARKAVELHTRYPDWNIVVTYQTRSLKNQICNLIDKFYKIKNDGKSPNYDKLKVIHAWGSKVNRGLYYDICLEHGIEPLTYTDAKNLYNSSNAFEGACAAALKNINTYKKIYDCIIIDEAQDFKKNFYKLCLNVLTKEKRLIYAYDELQNLSNSTMPSPLELFGINIKCDTPLKVCYRNQSEVIVTAHAIGSGLYRESGLIQLPSSSDVWEAIGYKSGTYIKPGEKVVLYRDKETSPDILNTKRDDLVKFINCESKEAQSKKTIEIIKEELEDGIPYNEIIIIDMDSIAYQENRNDLCMFQISNDNLNDFEILNIHAAGSSSPEDFFRKKSIVYSSIFRAKGNEAYLVIIVNAQKCVNSLSGTKDRNSLFTAITRSKGWVRVLGYGSEMQELHTEFEKIKDNNFKLNFVSYPTEEELKLIVMNNKDIKQSDQQRLDDVRKIIVSLKKEGNTVAVNKILKELLGVYSDDEVNEVISTLKENTNE